MHGGCCVQKRLTRGCLIFQRAAKTLERGTGLLSLKRRQIFQLWYNFKVCHKEGNESSTDTSNNRHANWAHDIKAYKDAFKGNVPHFINCLQRWSFFLNNTIYWELSINIPIPEAEKWGSTFTRKKAVVFVLWTLCLSGWVCALEGQPWCYCETILLQLNFHFPTARFPSINIAMIVTQRKWHTVYSLSRLSK